MRLLQNKILYFIYGISGFSKALWLYFPAVFFLILAWGGTQKTVQGRDVVVAAGEEWTTILYTFIAVCFWAMVTWYSARLVTHFKFVNRKPPFWNVHFPRLMGYACFMVVEFAFLPNPNGFE